MDFSNSCIHQIILPKIKIGANFEIKTNKLLGNRQYMCFLLLLKIDFKFQIPNHIPQPNTKGDIFYKVSITNKLKYTALK